MGRIGLEKLVANLRDAYGYATNKFTLVGDAALVVHGVIKEVDKPVILVDKEVLISIAKQCGNFINDSTNDVHGKFLMLNVDAALLISTAHLPKYHCTEEVGPFTVETLSTIIMLLCVNGIEKNTDKLNKCFENGGYLLLEAWDSDLDPITNNYGKYPEIYQILDDSDEGEANQVMWKSLTGIESAKDDHIFLEYVGMMYVETN